MAQRVGAALMQELGRRLGEEDLREPDGAVPLALTELVLKLPADRIDGGGFLTDSAHGRFGCVAHGVGRILAAARADSRDERFAREGYQQPSQLALEDMRSPQRVQPRIPWPVR